MKTLFTILTSSFIIILSAQIASAQKPLQTPDDEINYISRITKLLAEKNSPVLNEVYPREQVNAGYLYCEARRTGTSDKELIAMFVDKVMVKENPNRQYIADYFSAVVVVAKDTLCKDVGK
jgi:hypothetical protein